MNIIKSKGLLIFTLCIPFFQLKAQLIKNTAKENIADWYNLSADQDGVYGADVNKAYQFLKDKAIKKKPVVAIIGFGLDTEHEDLKQAVWLNPNEKADGKDNDKNGWADDLHGWNFLGNTKGEMVDAISKVGDREFLRLRSKYEGIFWTGQNYVRFDDALNKPVKVTIPVDKAEFDYFKLLRGESQAAAASNTYQFAKFMKYYLLNDFDQEIKKTYPDDSKITAKEFRKIKIEENGQTDSVKMVAHMFLTSFMGTANPTGGPNQQPTTLDKFKENIIKTFPNRKEKYDNALAAIVDGRKAIEDNPNDVNQKNYGNGNLSTSSSFSSTMCAGIIAAARDNQLGVNGIAPNAELMSLRIYPKTGEIYYKDLALAIRYAVDQKADVILLGAPNSIYPPNEAKWVNDALLYASSKGILVVSPVLDLSKDLSKQSFYPNKNISAENELSNFLTVAASDSTGMPLKDGNFGKKELDVYAPGVNVSSTYMGSTYRKGTGSMLAAANVAGVAALIKAYYPQFTGTQLRSLIVGNVTLRDNVEVEKETFVKDRKVTDLFLFNELCVSGGILNAYKAILAADALSKQKQ
ncbi:S8 family serine peptidase [Pedobacter punctiformis]|uniref:S8 family serine peptidase n=1 Tax=Pedobacter punctiformis TaxID=3004097 RepID=A0ABT4LB35_9SPHI|nr:S8 family serine peptidase [Pedobacter sp. HCMS5-2]MCZ4245127.1 S8 family serine peptidase [Pedobacter sp. HCMS5-2]